MKLGIVTAAVGLAALTFAATPATAATLPATDSVYILPCDRAEFNGLLYQVDPTTGVATRVGDWVNPDPSVFSCAGPGAYNPVDGLGYWISWGSGVGHLNSVDLTTGVSTNIGQFTLAGVPYYTPIAMAIDSAGNAWATSWSVSPDVLYSLDLTTAELTEVGPTGVVPESGNYGLAWDPVTAAVYAYNVLVNDVYAVDTTTGAFTLFASDALVDVVPFAIAFDSAGQVWGINEDIESAPLSDLASSQRLEVINPYPDPEVGDIYSESIIIARTAVQPPAPAPALVATGASDTGSVALGAAGLVLLVAGALMTRRRARA